MKEYVVTDLITEGDIKRLDLTKSQSLAVVHDGRKIQLTLDVVFDMAKAGYIVKAGLMIEEAEEEQHTERWGD
ncbi:MAG: hypothetical protein GY759_11610 [Chloroflexi bacterium]|nr:hypothetical protein [Chloroflexota bacterium]